MCMCIFVSKRCTTSIISLGRNCGRLIWVWKEDLQLEENCIHTLKQSVLSMHKLTPCPLLQLCSPKTHWLGHYLQHVHAYGMLHAMPGLSTVHKGTIWPTTSLPVMLRLAPGRPVHYRRYAGEGTAVHSCTSNSSQSCGQCHRPLRGAGSQQSGWQPALADRQTCQTAEVRACCTLQQAAEPSTEYPHTAWK